MSWHTEAELFSVVNESLILSAEKAEIADLGPGTVMARAPSPCQPPRAAILDRRSQEKRAG